MVEGTPAVNVTVCRDWRHFEDELEQLQTYRGKMKSGLPLMSDLLFRGHSNSEWRLQSTLERYAPDLRTWWQYIRAARLVRTHVETMSGRRWDDLDSDWTHKSDALWSDGGPLRGYPYLAYLRHHGFPSPLLDWSRSPYVAAFFAFREPPRSPLVSVYAYIEDIGGGKTTGGVDPLIHTLGHYVNAHVRHALQQCEYSFCSAFKPLDTESDREWCLACHEDFFAAGHPQQDLLWKFNIPSRERVDVLRRLDNYNLNAYSLFQTEDALLEVAALRAIDFKREG
jgi:hypothetical protein